MSTAVRLDAESGHSKEYIETNHHFLNVSHMCTGMALELAFKAFALSENKIYAKNHEANRYYNTLNGESRAKIIKFVEDSG